MPYIEQARRNEILTTDVGPANAGELTFLLSEYIDRYHGDNGLSFESIGQVIVALEAAKLEYYRRIVARYEGVKAINNGDVYLRTNALLAQVRPTPIQSNTNLAAENAKAELRTVTEADVAPEPEPEGRPGVEGVDGGWEGSA
jgi:hypothetical protein